MNSKQITKFLDYLQLYMDQYWDIHDTLLHKEAKMIYSQMLVELADTLEREAKEIRSAILELEV